MIKSRIECCLVYDIIYTYLVIDCSLGSGLSYNVHQFTFEFVNKELQADRRLLCPSIAGCRGGVVCVALLALLYSAVRLRLATAQHVAPARCVTVCAVSHLFALVTGAPEHKHRTQC